MPAFVQILIRCLAWIGRHGAAGFALAMLAGIALPALASTFRPVLPVTIFLFVALTFARADFEGVRRVFAARRRLALMTTWITLCMPIIILPAVLAIGREHIEPGLLLGIALVAAAPPLMGFPAYAALLGLDNSIGIALLLVTMSAAPLIAPSLASLVAGAAVPIDPVVLGLRLASLLGGSGLLALLLRRFVGPPRLAALRHELDGLNVVIYFIFAIAAMDGVIDAALSSPATVALHLAVGCGIAAVGLATTYTLMRPIGRPDAFVLGLGTGMRNSGLLVASLGAACPTTTYLFFSLLQIPIYCAPLVVTPLVRKLKASA